jgi:effector-binding domain-containing protein
VSTARSRQYRSKASERQYIFGMISAVETLDIPEQFIAVIKDRAKQSELPQKVPAYCGQVWTFIHSRPDIKSNGRMIATYRGSDKNDLQIEVGAQVEAPFKFEGPVVSASIPACRAAMVTLAGPYSDMHNAYDMLFAWCKQNGHKSGVCWELYYHPEPAPAPPKTDIFAQLIS